MPYRTPSDSCTVEHLDRLGSLLREFLTLLGADAGTVDGGVALGMPRVRAASGPRHPFGPPGPRLRATRSCTVGRGGRWR